MMAGGSRLSKYHTRQRFPLLRWLPVWMQHRTPPGRELLPPVHGLGDARDIVLLFQHPAMLEEPIFGLRHGVRLLLPV